MTKSTKIHETIFIKLPVERVFNYATTPANWIHWHPATIEVEGDVDHSGRPDDQICEKVKIGLFRGVIDWTVKENQAPKRWVFEGFTKLPLNKGTRPNITYQCSPQNGGTLFERILIYTPPTPLSRFLNWLLLKRNNRSQSKLALKNLKRVLEESLSQ